MKKILYIFLLIHASETTAQNKHLYSSIQAIGYPTKQAFGGGPHLSVGYHDNGIGFGPGAGLILFGTENPMIPVYFNFIYAGGSKKRLSPMANFHVGKMFYKGYGTFIGEESYLIGGFYAHVVGGVAVKVKQSKAHVFAGLTLMSFQNPLTATNFNQSIFNTGVGFFFVD